MTHLSEGCQNSNPTPSSLKKPLKETIKTKRDRLGMNNRFGTYLQSQKLAKLLIVQAKNNLQRGNDHKALRDTIEAMQTFFTCTNCLASLASLALEHRKHRKQ